MDIIIQFGPGGETTFRVSSVVALLQELFSMSDQLAALKLAVADMATKTAANNAATVAAVAAMQSSKDALDSARADLAAAQASPPADAVPQADIDGLTASVTDSSTSLGASTLVLTSTIAATAPPPAAPPT